MDNLCKLCRENDLQNVGSHIFTESIIRTALSEDGYSKRANKELIFEISPKKVGLDYFGMGIQPEKIEQITGKPISDEQILANENPFINRNLVCRRCEKRFGPIETEFVEKIYSKIIKKSNHEQFKNACNYILFETQKWLAVQFIIINIWRASASNFNNWKLHPDHEEYLRSFIYKTANDDILEIIKATILFKDEIQNFDFAINYFIQESEDLTENVVLIDVIETPYFILLNRLSIVFDFKPLSSMGVPELLLEIIDQNINCIIASEQDQELKIGINSEKQRKLVLYRIANQAAKQLIQKFNHQFIEMHRQFFGFFPPLNSLRLYSEEMKHYVDSKGGEVEIDEMLNLINRILYSCGRSYNYY